MFSVITWNFVNSETAIKYQFYFYSGGTLTNVENWRLDYRSETTAGGSGVTFFIERHTTGDASFSPTFRIHTAGSGVGASFVVGGASRLASYTLAGTGASFVSSSGVAGSVISGDYLRLNFTNVGSAAIVSMSMILEEQ